MRHKVKKSADNFWQIITDCHRLDDPHFRAEAREAINNVREYCTPRDMVESMQRKLARKSE